MKRFRPLLRRYVEDTARPPEASRRVRQRLDRELGAAGSQRAALQDLGGAPPGARQRVLARVRAERRTAARPGSWRWWWIPGRHPVRPALQLVAVAALLVGALLVIPGREGPEPIRTAADADRPRTPAQRPAPLPLSADLRSADWQELALAGGVHLRFRGAGAVEGTSTAPRIAWTAGALEVEVTPGLGIDLVVETAEGSVRVVGTGFGVRRDLLGTGVDIRHGRVEVRCGEDDPRLLAADERALCTPVTAAGLLGRARALSTAGASPSVVLEAVDAGLGRADRADPTWAELQFVRVECLAALGRFDEARRAAAEYLGSGHGARRAEVEALLEPGD